MIKYQENQEPKYSLENLSDSTVTGTKEIRYAKILLNVFTVLNLFGTVILAFHFSSQVQAVNNIFSTRRYDTPEYDISTLFIILVYGIGVTIAIRVIAELVIGIARDNIYQRELLLAGYIANKELESKLDAILTPAVTKKVSSEEILEVEEATKDETQE